MMVCDGWCVILCVFLFLQKHFTTTVVIIDFFSEFFDGFGGRSE